jgi:glycosyltransferase involved in cell wall biosynthesis
MHVCMLLGGTFPPDIRVAKEARALLAAGQEVTLLCRGGREDPRYETVDGVGVIRFRRVDPVQRVVGLASGLANLAVGVYPQWVRAIDRALRAGVDAIHVHDLPLVRTALVASAGRDVPVVADLHENYPEATRQWRRRRNGETTGERLRFALERTGMSISRLKCLERSCVTRADRVLTVCAEGRRHYVRDCGASSTKVSVIGNTVDLDRFDASLPGQRSEDGRRESDGGEENEREARLPGFATFEESDFLATYVGRLGAHRGLETVLDALARLEERSTLSARLVIVGPDDSENAAVLHERARGLGVADRLSFTGWVEFEEVPRYMAASDACLVPHAATPHTETTVPHKLFQYMAASRPVLATDVAPLQRIVGGHEAGIVTPAGDGAAMAAAIETLSGEPERADRLGRNGRRAVEERFDWARDAEALRGIYRELDSSVDADTDGDSRADSGSTLAPDSELGRAGSD